MGFFIFRNIFNLFILSVFLSPSFGRENPDSPICYGLIKNLWASTGIAYRNDPQSLRKTIQTVTGIRAHKELAVAVDEIESWVKKYHDFDKDMQNLRKARSRYISDNPQVYLGRIEIFEQALKAGIFPVELTFNRDPYFKSRSEIITPKSGQVRATEIVSDGKELEAYIKKDRKNVEIIDEQLLRREIFQAELYLRIKQFISQFSTDSVEKARTRLEKLAADPEALKTLEVRPLKLISDADNLIRNSAKPSVRAIAFVEDAVKKGRLPAIIGQRNIVEFSTRAGGTVLGLSLKLKNHIATATALIALAVSGLTYTQKFNDKVAAPIYNNAVLSDEELKEKELMAKLKVLEKDISMPAIDLKNFDWDYFQSTQKNWDDEAVQIAWEVIKGKRSDVHIDPAKDRDMNPEKYESYLDQANQIISIRQYLLLGYQNEFGKIVGVKSRLKRRSETSQLVTLPDAEPPNLTVVKP